MKKSDNSCRTKENEVESMIATYEKAMNNYACEIADYAKKLESMPKEKAQKLSYNSLVRTGVITKNGNPRKIVK